MHRFHAKDSAATAQNAEHPEWVFTLRTGPSELIPTASDLRHRFRRDGDHLVPDTTGSGGAIYDLEPVSRWLGTPPADRPEAFCPVCLARVITKCGEVLRPHYAHWSEGSTCPASAPESALHLNSKLRIASELRKVKRLRIKKICAGDGKRARGTPCELSDVDVWVEGWDDVLVEYELPSARADVILLKQGRPIAAIEVHVTHAVDAAKIGALRALGVPWVEVRARDILPEPGEGVPWSSGMPLPVRRSNREAPQPYRCTYHREKWESQRQEQIAKGTPWRGRAVRLSNWEEQPAQYHEGPVWHSRLVQVLAMKSGEEGWPAEIWLVNALTKEVLSERVRCADEAAALMAADRALHALTAPPDREMESPMGWVRPAGLLRALPPELYPGRLRWTRPGEAPRIAPNAAELHWPSDTAQWDAYTFHPLWGCDASWCDLPDEGRAARFHSIRDGIWFNAVPHEDEIIVEAWLLGAEGWIKVAHDEFPTPAAGVDLCAVLNETHTALHRSASADVREHLRGPHFLSHALQYAMEPFTAEAKRRWSWKSRSTITGSPSRDEILAELDRVVDAAAGEYRFQGEARWKVDRRDGYSERAGDWIDRAVRLDEGFRPWGAAFAIAPSAAEVTGRLLELERNANQPIHPYWLSGLADVDAIRAKVGAGYTCLVVRIAGGSLQVVVQDGVQVPFAEFVRAVCQHPGELTDRRPLRPDAYRFPLGSARVDVFPAWTRASSGKDVEVVLGGRVWGENFWLPIIRVHELHRMPDGTVWAECDVAQEGEVAAADGGKMLYAPRGYRRALVCLSGESVETRWNVQDRRAPEGYLWSEHEEWSMSSAGYLRGGSIESSRLLARMASGAGRTYLVLGGIIGSLEAIRGVRSIRVDEDGWCEADLIRNPEVVAPEVPGWEVRTGHRIYSRVSRLRDWKVVLESGA